MPIICHYFQQLLLVRFSVNNDVAVITMAGTWLFRGLAVCGPGFPTQPSPCWVLEFHFFQQTNSSNFCRGLKPFIGLSEFHKVQTMFCSKWERQRQQISSQAVGQFIKLADTLIDWYDCVVLLINFESASLLLLFFTRKKEWMIQAWLPEIQKSVGKKKRNLWGKIS